MDSTTTLSPPRPDSTQMAVEAFRALANLISTGTLPPPHGGPLYRWVSSSAEVEAFAATHNVPVKRHGSNRRLTTARLVVGQVSPGIAGELEYVMVFAEDAS